MLRLHKLLPLTLLLFLPISAQSAPPSIHEKSQKIENFEHAIFDSGVDYRTASQAIEREFQRLFAGDFNSTALLRRSSSDLKELFLATSGVAMYSTTPQNVQKLESVFSVLEARNLLSQQITLEMLSAYLGVRDFGSAERLQKRLNLTGVPELPRVLIDGSATPDLPTIWKVSPNKLEISKVPFKFPKGPFVIVISSPMCHFSENALTEFDKSIPMSSVLSQNALLLIPQDNNFNISAVQEWQSRHPLYSVAMVNRQDEWASISDWSLPTFYFFYDGQLKSSFSGWPRGGNNGQLLLGLTSIGLNQ